MLIAGLGRMKKNNVDMDAAEAAAAQELADKAEATKPGDAPDATDDAVDICIESVVELKSVLPSLWNTCT